eukprot:CAMPEP_0172510246 /NCGR_PEP_ID=MMETSP1066-20121228/227262_1 /TAXON_ID=671091 /ORGANISM="Coscinodiscus wailesii, Strain CCMP2513" /LENGTH=57 /DNA_ID=CAMNT_0013289117 /DNA_START=339 /DNA_END=513 /DNA_ORIENTATION=-
MIRRSLAGVGAPGSAVMVALALVPERLPDELDDEGLQGILDAVVNGSIAMGSAGLNF